MAVLPAYRGHGVGTRLLEYLLRAADERYEAVLSSVAANNPALRLYRRFRFEVVGAGGSSLTLKRERGRARKWHGLVKFQERRGLQVVNFWNFQPIPSREQLFSVHEDCRRKFPRLDL
jgi:GNAT superfamily N-acetyltransferase